MFIKSEGSGTAQPAHPKTLKQQIREDSAYALGRGLLTMMLILAVVGAAVLPMLHGPAMLPLAIANVMFWAAAHEIGAALFDRLDLALVAEVRAQR